MRGEVQRIGAPVRRRRPLHKSALFELVDQTDKVRALDAERVAHLILPQSGVEFDNQQRGILRRRNSRFPKYLLETFKGSELRAPQRVAKPVRQRSKINCVPSSLPIRCGIAAAPLDRINRASSNFRLT